jgi:dCMP deaminase
MTEHRSQLEWDIYWMKEAELVATMSKCLSRKIGSVLVKDNYRIASGYNGAPRGVDNCDKRDDWGNYTDHHCSDICPRQRMNFKSGEGIEHCAAVHAERNSLLQAARMGITTAGATLYCWCRLPCPDCMKEIINAGVSRVVCFEFNEYLPTGMKCADLVKQSGIKVDYISKDVINGKKD